MEARQNAPFTAFGTEAPDSSAFISMMASLNSASSTATKTSPSSVEATPTAISANSFTQSASAASIISDTISPSSSLSSTSTISSSAIPSATNFPLNTSGGMSTSDSCNSISCSPKLQAAVAVPVVVGLVIVISLAILLAGRKRKHTQQDILDETSSEKNWTRHLRIFPSRHPPFCAGRFSSNDSVRSGESGQRSTEVPSMRSIEDAAPSYPDALSHQKHPTITEIERHTPATTLAAPKVQRSTSKASAPPSYSNAGSLPPTIQVTPAHQIHNPFDDSTRESPVDGLSPFRDPSEDGRSNHSRPSPSRTSTMRTGQDSTWYDSDAGSIQEAQVGRHVSVMSAGGRTVNVRHSSQSPPASDQSSH